MWTFLSNLIKALLEFFWSKRHDEIKKPDTAVDGGTDPELRDDIRNVMREYENRVSAGGRSDQDRTGSQGKDILP